jgi:hypothetical protein
VPRARERQVYGRQEDVTARVVTAHPGRVVAEQQVPRQCAWGSSRLPWGCRVSAWCRVCQGRQGDR